MGSVAFAFDIPKLQQSSIWRDYPSLPVTTGAEFIERVKGIKTGEFIYLIEQWSGIIDLSRRYLTNIIRADVGIKPKDTPRPLYAFFDHMNRVGPIREKSIDVR